MTMIDTTIFVLAAHKSGTAYVLVIVPQEGEERPLALQGVWKFREYPNSIRLYGGSFNVLSKLGVRVTSFNREVAKTLGEAAKKKGGLSKLVMKPIKMKFEIGEEKKEGEEELPF